MDLWGVGCVYFEMLSLYPLFPGEKNEINQIDKIIQTIGPPSQKLLEKWRKQASHISFDFDVNAARKSLASKLPHVSRECIEVIEGLLEYDPEERLTATQAKNHAYFREVREQETKRYRQVTSIRTREKERESSYEK